MSDPVTHQESILHARRQHDPIRHQEPPKTAYLRARLFTYDLLHSPEIDTRLEHFVRTLISVLIVLSITAVVLESVQEIHKAIHPQLLILEWFSVIVFSL